MNLVDEQASSLSIGDLNSDGLMDLITVERYKINSGDITYINRVSIYPGSSGGGFTYLQSFQPGIRGPQRAIVTDLNSDGVNELLINFGAQTSGAFGIYTPKIIITE